MHARGQVVHLDLTEAEWLGLPRGHELDPAVAMLRRIRGALSRGLGDLTGAIEVHRVSLAPEGFDARFSALWRRYSYRIADGPALWDPLERYFTLWHKNPLDVDLLNEGAVQAAGAAELPVLLQAPGGCHHHPRTPALRVCARGGRRHRGHRPG